MKEEVEEEEVVVQSLVPCRHGEAAVTAGEKSSIEHLFGVFGTPAAPTQLPADFEPAVAGIWNGVEWKRGSS